MRISRKWAVVLLGPPIAFMIAFFVVPLLVMLAGSLRTPEGLWTTQNYAKVLFDFYYWDTLLLTLELALWVTLSAFVVGYPLAYYITCVVRSRTLRRVLYIIVVVPLFTSNIVRSFGWIVLLGRRGMVNDSLLGLGLIDRPVAMLYSDIGIVIGLGYIMTPFMVLMVSSVLQNIDRSLKEAALDLGASRLTTFLRITFPLSLPGVIAGSLIVFTLSVSAYVTPSIMSGGKRIVMSMLIFQQYGAVFNFTFGATLAATLLVTTLVLITGYLVVVDRGRPGKLGATG